MLNVKCHFNPLILSILLHCRHATIEVLPRFLIDRRKLADKILRECWRCFRFDRRLVVIKWQIVHAELIVIGDFGYDELRRHEDCVVADWARLAYITAKDFRDARRSRFDQIALDVVVGLALVLGGVVVGKVTARIGCWNVHHGACQQFALGKWCGASTMLRANVCLQDMCINARKRAN